LERIKHGFKTLAECGGISGVDDTSSFFLICDLYIDLVNQNEQENKQMKNK
jgi:hypothetical protein